MPSISIIVPFAGSTADLVPDLKVATAGAELIIVDNASDEATQQAIASMEPAVYIRNERNLGFAAANNQGYARATGDIILFLNSDVAAAPGWLQAVAADVRHEGLYGPSLQYQLVYGMWLPYLEGWCLAATRDTWRGLILPLPGYECGPYEIDDMGPWNGPWDEEIYAGPYWEDNDLCCRAMEAGIRLVHTAWQVQHKGGRTAGALIKHGESFERNRAAFAARVAPLWRKRMEVEHGA